MKNYKKIEHILISLYIVQVIAYTVLGIIFIVDNKGGLSVAWFIIAAIYVMMIPAQKVICRSWY